jgi:ABC-type amino acid transport system permease subunit
MIEGVVRAPSEFSMTLGVLPSKTATQLLVVPRSMPIILPMINSSIQII